MIGQQTTRLDKSDREALIALVTWIVCAFGVLSLNEQADALQFMWLPSAVAVASIFAAKPHRWPKAILAIAVACMATHLWYGFGLVASLGYTLANLVQALFVVIIARKVTRNRLLFGLGLGEMAGLFLAALGGSVLAILLSWPFRAENEPLQLLWLVLSMTLGTSVGAPILLYCRAWIKGYRPTPGCELTGGLTLRFVATFVFLFGLAWLVLAVESLPLAPLMMTGLLLAVASYGQFGASLGVFLFAVAATVNSIGDARPAAYLDLPPFENGLVLQGFMLVMLATSLPLAALLTRHNRLAVRLKARNARMRENLVMLKMAEEVARIGRWRFNPKTGEQDWSKQMFRINGLDPDVGRDPGDLRRLLPDRGEALFGELNNHATDRAPYSFEYPVRTPGGEDRILKMQAMNEFAVDGELQNMFGVVMDVTEHHRRQHQLDNERSRAMRLAAEAQYLAQTDALTGLANRRRTLEQLEKCIKLCARNDQKLALIAFDIDFFKLVNDRFGHQVGDEVLIRVADIAREQVRASDLIGRTGGEEFIWLLPGAEEQVVSNAAERLRKGIECGSAKGGVPGV